jgi:hypothetical protein
MRLMGKGSNIHQNIIGSNLYNLFDYIVNKYTLVLYSRLKIHKSTFILQLIKGVTQTEDIYYKQQITFLLVHPSHALPLNIHQLAPSMCKRNTIADVWGYRTVFLFLKFCRQIL